MISNIFHYFVTTIEHWGVYGVFVNMFLENAAVPIPTEPGYIVSINLVRMNVVSWINVGIIIVIAQMLGAILSYNVGKLGYSNTRLHNLKSFKRAHSTLQSWYSRWGDRIIFIARIVGYVRPWSSLVAGIAGADYKIFVRYTFWGTIIHVVLSLVATHYLVEIWEKYSGLHYILALTVIMSLTGSLLYGIFRKVNPNH